MVWFCLQKLEFHLHPHSLRGVVPGILDALDRWWRDVRMTWRMLKFQLKRVKPWLPSREASARLPEFDLDLLKTYGRCRLYWFKGCQMDMIGDALLKMLLDQYEIPKSSRDQVWRGKKQWGWLAIYLGNALRLGVMHFRVAARSLAAMRHLPQRPTQSDNADEIGHNVSIGQEWESHTLPREPFIIPIFWAYTGFQGKFLLSLRCCLLHFLIFIFWMWLVARFGCLPIFSGFPNEVAGSILLVS